jgi:hypothetical protein
MYTAANAARDLAVVAGAWLWTIGVILWQDAESSVTCNGHGCSVSW